MKLLSITLIVLLAIQVCNSKSSSFLKTTKNVEFNNLFEAHLSNFSLATKVSKSFIQFQTYYLTQFRIKPLTLSTKFDIVDRKKSENNLIFTDPSTNSTEIFKPVQIELLTPSNTIIENGETDLEIQIFHENVYHNRTLVMSIFFQRSNRSSISEETLSRLISSFGTSKVLDFSIFNKFVQFSSLVNYHLPSYTNNKYDWVVSMETLPISEKQISSITQFIKERNYLKLFKNKLIKVNNNETFVYYKKTDMISLERAYFEYEKKHLKANLRNQKFTDIIEEEDFNDFDFMNLIELMSLRRQEEGGDMLLEEKPKAGKNSSSATAGEEAMDFSNEDNKKNDTKQPPKNATSIPTPPPIPVKPPTPTPSPAVTPAPIKTPAPAVIPQPVPKQTELPKVTPQVNSTVPSSSSGAQNTLVQIPNSTNGTFVNRSEDIINLPQVFKHENVYINQGVINVDTTLIIGKRC